MMALKFFELGRLSLGQAAEVAGYSKRAFIDVLGEYGIPVAHYPARDCLPRGRMVKIAAVPPLLDALDANPIRIRDSLCDAKLKLAGESVG
jgi:hypothetical protein